MPRLAKSMPIFLKLVDWPVGVYGAKLLDAGHAYWHLRLGMPLYQQMRH